MVKKNKRKDNCLILKLKLHIYGAVLNIPLFHPLRAEAANGINSFLPLPQFHPPPTNEGARVVSKTALLPVLRLRIHLAIGETSHRLGRPLLWTKIVRPDPPPTPQATPHSDLSTGRCRLKSFERIC
ncbi:hypothetical protein CDAR_106311 [Caerostris darwini]|uniref:Uncharacterized protein n=1 Tax=Caerostris darwini TaxID=1538125 RepID=A0AAV4SJX3_9ARAC|nr:hypothetical protein CDAR_106311 [Caerostris darwini]